MIYINAYIKVYLQDFHYYLLIPLMFVFKQYRTFSRCKYMVSYYLTMLRMRMELVQEINDTDEAIYESEI